MIFKKSSKIVGRVRRVLVSQEPSLCSVASKSKGASRKMSLRLAEHH
jgi:hypothetical protein